MDKVVVIGGAGFMGSHAADELTKGFELQEDSPSLELDDEGFLINSELEEAMM